MFTDGQIVQRDEVEQWVRDEYPQHPHFLASVTEKEDEAKGRVYVTVRITGPNAQPLGCISRKAEYFSMRDMIGMPQAESEWVA